MKNRPVLLATWLLMLLISCNVDYTSEANEKDKESVKMFFPNWVAEFMKTRNADDYFKNVSDDYVIMGCGFEPITSRDAVASEIKNLISSDVKIKVEDFQSQEIIIRDDVAIHRYSCFEVVTSKTDTTESKVAFHYLDILNKTPDGKWKLHLHVAMPKQ